MQRIANPSTPVRFRPQPPVTKAIDIECNSVYARVVELVDTRDLKSLEGNFVPVRVRPRAPFPPPSFSQHERSYKKMKVNNIIS